LIWKMMSFAPNRQRWIRWTLAIAVVVWLIPCLPLAAGQKRATVRKSRVHHRRRRHYSHYRRYLQVRIQPARVKEIQEALVKAGFLHKKPDSVWGSATRDAMKQFQKQNGFTLTGLPEAKPLMLLGLGPHPLPPGLGPLPSAGRVAESGSPDNTQASVAPAPPTEKKPTSSN
jgi:peptidoglycan hydrolase-like protein with peptidoglycan-binding domain